MDNDRTSDKPKANSIVRVFQSKGECCHCLTLWISSAMKGPVIGLGGDHIKVGIVWQPMMHRLPWLTID